MATDVSIFGLGIEFDERGARQADAALGKLERALDRVADSVDQMNVHLKKTDGFQKLTSASDQTARKLNELASLAKSVGSGLTVGLTVPLTALGTQSIQAAVRMDSLTRGLRAVTGSSAETEKQLARLREVAKLPGLGFQEAVQGAINLQAAGLSAKTSERALAAFGNALATVGKGKSELDGVILALSQIQSKGKVSAEEISQLAERVPQIRKAIAAAFGTADTEILQKAKITSDKFIDAILTELEKLPKATGGAQNTFENLADSYQQSMAKIGNASLRILAPALEKTAPLVESLGNKFAGLSPEAQTATVYIAGAAAAIGPLSYATGSAINAMTGLAAGIRTVNSVIGGSGGLLTLLGSVNPVVLGVSAAVIAGGVVWYEYSQRMKEAAAQIEQSAKRARGSIELLTGEQNRSITLADGTNVNLLPGRDTAINPGLLRGSTIKGTNTGLSDLRASAGTKTPPKINLAGSGSGKGGTAAITEAQRLRDELKKLNQEIAFLSNPNSVEFGLTRQIISARAEAERLRDALRGIIKFPEVAELKGGLVPFGYTPDSNIPLPASVLAAQRAAAVVPNAPPPTLTERASLRLAEFERDRERIQTNILRGVTGEADGRRQILRLEREYGAAQIAILQAMKQRAGLDAETIANLDAQIERARQLGIELSPGAALRAGLREGGHSTEQIYRDIGAGIRNSVHDGIFTGLTEGGRAGLQLLLNSFASTFAGAASEMFTNAIFNALGNARSSGGGGGGGGFWSTVLGFVGNVLTGALAPGATAKVSSVGRTTNVASTAIHGLRLAGARADGGDVFAGMAYLVGERGPELFVPPRSGFIVPNDQMSGVTNNRTVSVNITIIANDVESFRRSKAQIAREMTRAAEDARRFS